MTKAERLSAVRRRAASGEARTIRQAARLTLEDVGSAIGTHHTTVARWERGERTPTGTAAIKYGQLLDRLSASLVVEEAS